MVTLTKKQIKKKVEEAKRLIKYYEDRIDKLENGISR